MHKTPTKHEMEFVSISPSFYFVNFLSSPKILASPLTIILSNIQKKTLLNASCKCSATIPPFFLASRFCHLPILAIKAFRKVNSLDGNKMTLFSIKLDNTPNDIINSGEQFVKSFVINFYWQNSKLARQISNFCWCLPWQFFIHASFTFNYDGCVVTLNLPQRVPMLLTRPDAINLS